MGILRSSAYGIYFKHENFPRTRKRARNRKRIDLAHIEIFKSRTAPSVCVFAHTRNGFTTVSPYVLCTDVEIMVEMTDVRPVGLRYRPSRPVKAALVNAERHPWLPSAEVTSEVNRMAFYFSAANAAHWSPPAEAALTPCTKSLRVTPSGV